jgi:hypothetical protein
MADVVAQSPALGEPYLLDIQDGIFDYTPYRRSRQDDTMRRASKSARCRLCA